MTNQEAFDKIVARLMDGTGRAVSSSGACRYRTLTGLKCAVGCLIPDEEYRGIFEGQTADNLRAFNIPSLKGLDYNLLYSTQRLHDDPKNWDDTKFKASGLKKLREVARFYRLTMPKI